MIALPGTLSDKTLINVDFYFFFSWEWRSICSSEQEFIFEYKYYQDLQCRKHSSWNTNQSNGCGVTETQQNQSLFLLLAIFISSMRISLLINRVKTLAIFIPNRWIRLAIRLLIRLVTRLLCLCKEKSSDISLNSLSNWSSSPCWLARCEPELSFARLREGPSCSNDVCDDRCWELSGAWWFEG